MITVNSPIVGRGGSVEEALAALDTPDAIDAEYAGTLLRLCNETGLDYRIAFGQFCVETANGTSPRWLTNRNPAGLGIVSDGDNDPGKWDGTDAAMVHVWALTEAIDADIVITTDQLPKSAQAFAKRWTAKYLAPECPTVATIADLGKHYIDSNGEAQAVWGWDATYAKQVAAKANRIFTDTGGTTMGLYAVAGLATKIELPVPLVQAIIPSGQTNQRPGITRQLPGYWVQHETANTNAGANAQMHSTWLHNGADGSQLSFHFAVDDGQIIQLIPINEVTWQAADGAGPGNMSGISCELCVNQGIDTAKARHNAEALCAGIMKALGMGPDRVKAHYDFNQADPDRHHCPDTMLSSGYWPRTFVANVGRIISGIDAVAEPFAITWNRGDVGIKTIGATKAIALLGEAKAKRTVALRQSTNSASPKVGEVKQGETVVVVGTSRSDNKQRWIFIDMGNGKYGRALASAFEPSYPTL